MRYLIPLKTSFHIIYNMESSQHLETRFQIPNDHIYKIFVLNDKGKITRAHIFCSDTLREKDLPGLFSEVELAYYKKENVDFVFSPLVIHSDDTIRTIKHKIIQEFELYYSSQKEYFTCGPEEIYMFSSKAVSIDFSAVFLKITENKRETITKEEFYHYASLLSLNPFENNMEREAENKRSFSPNKTSYSWSDWNELSQTYEGKIFIPVGMDFQTEYDFLFPSNPYNTQLATSPIRYQFKSKNALYSMENSLLLNYLDNDETTIMVCLGNNVLDYGLTNEISTKYLSQLYFPQLYSMEIENLEHLQGQKEDLHNNYKKEYNNWLKHRNEIVDLYFDIYNSRKTSGSYSADLPYMEKGIQEISFTFYSEEFKGIFPLDFLFKQLHCSETIPFIKYNPGTRRENMFRLYSKEISRNGKKIPFLDDSLILKLNKELKKGNHITLYLKQPDPIHVYLDHYGKFLITCAPKTPMEIDVLEQYLVKHLTPLFETIKTLVQPLGYTIHFFEKFQDTRVKHMNMNYGFSLAMDKKLTLQKKPYLHAIFDVRETQIHKTAHLRLKRVENYKEMDAKNSKIVELIGKGATDKDILHMLSMEYGMDRNEAILEYGEFRSQYQLFKERVVENPGFPVFMKMKPLKNELHVSVKDITSSKYLYNIFVYLDTILRISQSPKTIGLEKKKMEFFEKPFKGKEEEMEVDNIIHAVGTEKPVGNFVAQPLRFGEEEQKESPPINNQGIIFDEDFEYEEEEEEDVEVEGEADSDDSMYGGQGDEDLEEKKKELDGKSIKNPTPFFKKMMEHDPVLFVTEETSKYPLYSKACPSGDRRQPVVLTKAEKERIDETNPGSYGHALLHGSSPENQYYYVCPRYWCLLTNSSISEEDVKAGKCGNIIPRGADTIPKGSYVYEFNNPKIHMKEGKYVQHVPGFLKKSKHPDGLCIPCCFGKEWDSNDQRKRREQCGYGEKGDVKEKGETYQAIKTQAYIIGPVSYPLPIRRWGFLPVSVQLFFDEDSTRYVDPQNPSVILPNTSLLLRYGLEQSDTRSFMGVIAYYYAYKQGLDKVPTIEEMSTLLATLIDLDLFLKIQNGNLPGIFRPKMIDLGSLNIDKYSTTDFFQSIDLKDDAQMDFLEEMIASYENFLDYLQDVDAQLDYTFLWDIVCMDNPKIMRDGFNLAILNVSESDLYEKVQFVCPSNVFSNLKFDPRKETIILLQQDIYYEPIHLYENKETIVSTKTGDVMYSLKPGETVIKNVVVNRNRDEVYKIRSSEIRSQSIFMKKAFLEQTAMEPIKEMLTLIKETAKEYCAPLPSLPRKYKFKTPVQAQDLLRLLKNSHYKVDIQIVNYRNKTVGLMANQEEDQTRIYVPCYPSAHLEGMKKKFMDEPELWLDYRTTRDRLEAIHTASNGKIPCKVKIKIVEDELVVGFLTDTNQFVQINPPSQVIDEDGIPIVRHSSYILPNGELADKTLTTVNQEDKKRKETVLKIQLETDFYNVFRSLARQLLHEQENYKTRKSILDIIDDKRQVYVKQLKAMEKELRSMMDPYVSFQEIKDDDLESIQSIMVCKGKTTCDTTTGKEWKTCLQTQDGVCQNIFPKNHLLGKRDNNRVYFGRLADELLRYERIRVFMLEPKRFLNIGNANFEINEDELFLLESVLQKDYFTDLVPYSKNSYVKNIEYDNAQPSETTNYSNKLSLEMQDKMKKETKVNEVKVSDYIVDCIKETRQRVIGNEKAGSWKPLFPTHVQEIIFEKSKVCTYMPLIYLFQDLHKGTDISVQNIKTSLWKGYQELIGQEGNVDKIVTILNKQGKTELMSKVKSRSLSLEAAVFSDSYYLTDLDYWVFCNYNKLPVILFSSTTLKYLSNQINWLCLGGQGRNKEQYYFIRSSAERVLNDGSSYHLLMPPVPLEEMKNTMFIEAREGNDAYEYNWQSIDSYLLKYHLIKKRKT